MDSNIKEKHNISPYFFCGVIQVYDTAAKERVIQNTTQRALPLKWHFPSSVLQHFKLYTSRSPYFSEVAYTHQPPGACRHWQLRRILADLFSARMTAAAVLEAKVDISAENMVLITVFEKKKLDSSRNWLTPQEQHENIVFFGFFFFLFTLESVTTTGVHWVEFVPSSWETPQ